MKPYESEEEKAVQIGRMFDRIAPTYDRLNHLLSFSVDRLWRRRLVGLVSARRPKTVLDMATGTGDLALAMARRIPGASIVGADISHGMLAVARKKAAGTPEVKFVHAAAEELPFAEGAFDAATVAFGVRNFQDIPAALEGFRRVLVGGGALYVLEFSGEQDKILSPFYRFYSHRVLPLVGGLVSRHREAYRYLPLSVDEFPAAASFTALMEAAGFERCESKKLTGGIARIYIGFKP